jgi:Caspase domain
VYRALIVCNYRFPAAQGSLRDLQGPKRDGLLLRDALTDHDTGTFEKANVRDPLNDATSGEILEAVEEFFESAEPDDTLLFYYSGHGRSRDQELYLCAQNTDPSRLRSTAVSGRVLNLRHSALSGRLWPGNSLCFLAWGFWLVRGSGCWRECTRRVRDAGGASDGGWPGSCVRKAKSALVLGDYGLPHLVTSRNWSALRDEGYAVGPRADGRC